MEKGLVSVTFRQKKPEEIITLATQAGLTAIEWGGDIHVPHGDVKTAKVVGEMTRKAGLTAVSYGSYYQCLPGELTFDAVLETAEALGAKVIRVWAGNKDFDKAEEEKRNQVYEALRYAVEAAGSRGITVATEMHRNTLTNSLEGALTMLEKVPGLMTYWQPSSQRTLEEECAIISRLGKYIVGTHIAYWKENVQYPLADARERLERYIDVLNRESRAGFMLLEFVAGHSVQQFYEDAHILLNPKCCYEEPYAECVQRRAYIQTGGNPVRLRPSQSAVASLGWAAGNNAC